MANSKLVSTKYLLRLRSQEEWEGLHFRAKAHFRKSGAWRLIREGHRQGSAAVVGAEQDHGPQIRRQRDQLFPELGRRRW